MRAASNNDMFDVLTAAEMRKADAACIAGGTGSLELMDAAGDAVARQVIAFFKPCPVLVLCGPGNNGGDGFFAAAKLKREGWPVRVACLVRKAALKGDAALAAKEWGDEIESLNSNLSVHQTGLVIDAVFGTGFDRALEPELGIVFDKIRARKIPVVAVDVPSGLDASTGMAAAGTLKADRTVTFGRWKVGHLLYPGRALCGWVHVADIGLTPAHIAASGVTCYVNVPDVWLKDFPWPAPESHKYMRGHTLVYGGAARTGAACLSAMAAQKIGAGVVSIASLRESFALYAACRASIMVDATETLDDWKSLLRDERKNTIVIGPGAGADDRLRASVEAALTFNKSGVLDADVFTAYQAAPQELFSRLSPHYVLTPHEGEFERLFGAGDGSKLERVRAAAQKANAVVLLKGADTVVAAPDGTAVINTNAPPTLATAGSGDVLAGIIAGLISQGMPAFPAAAAGVWLHGEAAQAYGLGLTAEDIIIKLPQVLNTLYGLEKNHP